MVENRSKSDGFMLRFPDGMREMVKDRAESNGRSMNAEIVAAIESALSSPDLSSGDLRRLLDEERAFNSKISNLLESQFDLLTNYKGVMQTANTQTLQQANVIRSLCSIISSLDPSADVLEVVQRLSEVSQNMLKQAKADALMESAREEVRDVNRLIAKADDLLSKPKK
jgi:hypothetical protein